MSVLSAELHAWLQPGLAGVIAVVNDRGEPQIARVWAVRALAEPDLVELAVQRSAAADLLDVVAAGRRAAINLVEVATYRSRMLKGFCTPSSVDQTFVDACVAAQDAAFASVGMAGNAAQRILGHDASMVGFQLKVDRVFDQSPKPGAGGPL